MLEKLAELVREEGLPPVHYCEYCKRYNPLACECRHTEGECEPAADKKNMAFARYAVLLVARALEKWVAEIDRTNGVDLGDVEALGSEFMDLYYEVKKAEAKELNIGKVDG